MQTRVSVRAIRVRVLFMALLLTALHSAAFAARPIIGDAASEIREKAARGDGNMHVDTPAMIARLTALHVTDYFFLIWHEPSDWDDFRNEFVPAAAQAGINVWAYIVPPSECKPTCSQPFGEDYVRWATEIARLSVTHPNVKGMVIDDFSANPSAIPPPYANQIHRAGKAVNPNFLFYPLVYWGGAFTSPTYFDRYAQAIDGFIFAYRDEPNVNTFSTETLPQQLAAAEAKSAAYRKPFLLLIYCTRLGLDSPIPTAAYIRTVTNAGLESMRQGKAQGIVTYVLDLHDRPVGASANFAQSGNGFGMIFLGGKTGPEAHGELRCPMKIQPGAASYALTFWHKNKEPAGVERGTLYMQVIAGSAIVWEEDVTQGSTGWTSETVRVPASALKGPNPLLRFILVNKAGVNARFSVGYDSLQTQGFSVQDPGFENPEAWEPYRDNAAFRESVQIFDPNQPRNLFSALAGMYSIH